MKSAALPLIAVTLVAIFFFAPWVTLECHGRSRTLTGWQMATVQKTKPGDCSSYPYPNDFMAAPGIRNRDAEPSIRALLLIPAAGIIALLSAVLKRDFIIKLTIVAVVCGLTAQTLQFAVAAAQWDYTEPPTFIADTTYQIGWWLVLAVQITMIYVAAVKTQAVTPP